MSVSLGGSIFRELSLQAPEPPFSVSRQDHLLSLALMTPVINSPFSLCEEKEKAAAVSEPSGPFHYPGGMKQGD